MESIEETPVVKTEPTIKSEIKLEDTSSMPEEQKASSLVLNPPPSVERKPASLALSPHPTVERRAHPLNSSSIGTELHYGDRVLFIEGHGNISELVLEEGKESQNHLGSFPHSEFSGRTYGRVYSSGNTGFAQMIPFSNPQWTSALSRRTQILYQPDISMIIEKAGLTRGQVVLEAGTGSGSLTHHLASRVGATGHVHTFDINSDRVEAAGDEFRLHGLSQVTGYLRDVCREGYPEELRSNEADLVFLDLPEPWLAVPHATAVMRVGAVFVAFSPCIEQVHKTLSALCEYGYGCFETCETCGISYAAEGRPLPVPPLVKVKMSKKKAQYGSLPGVKDSVILPSLRPSQTYRAHTGYLLFAQYFGIDE
eukprot:gnl/Dysnectes_brevis/4632_a6314_702.p1 GENE.gnl/Dysnectes_brevis/4632_a6314_702~~gnl/Dysnectes_brevis/4632_a6314_702.p1  ORF type:complete len:367 (-),score=104.23 gnl/Dysnectes_brevis/4632_a6314_702:39-1139(-)